MKTCEELKLSLDYSHDITIDAEHSYKFMQFSSYDLTDN